MSKLVIVESPAKAHTVGKILGPDYKVMASVGHIRDLPDRKEGIKREQLPDGTLRFTPDYVVPESKERVVQDLVREAKKADEIVLASDPDREGEAIAWHLKEEITKRLGGAAKPFVRVEYHEITPRAVKAAFAEPHGIDMARVDSQQARRCIDRYIGWRLSPRVARAVRGASAAGRVQSVALRLVCDREKEVRAFVPEAYWEFSVRLAKADGAAEPFSVRLRKLDGKKADVKDEASARRTEAFLAAASYSVGEAETRPVRKQPGAPFMTSSLQQAASNALHYSPDRTMALAQRLYESGLVTYMRTDTTNVAPEARQAAAAWIAASFGSEYADPHNYASGRKGPAGNPGGAHECIRPTDPAAVPDAVRASLSGTDAEGQAKLYKLIWERFVSSQMAAAVLDTTTVRVDAAAAAPAAGAPASAELTATAARVSFPGFLALRGAAAVAAAENEDRKEDDGDEQAALPPLAAGDPLACRGVSAERKETKPPARYGEAALVRALEQNGVGRPSTYASTIKTIKDRKYVAVEKRVLVPTETGEKTCDYLVAKFPEMMNVGYTAAMEEKLDDVQDPATNTGWQTVLGDFYRKLAGHWLPDAVDWADPAAVADLLEVFRGVSRWRAPSKNGARTFDDRKFVQDLAWDVMGVPRPKARERKADAPFRFDRPAPGDLAAAKVTLPQFEALGRTLLHYRDQVPGADAALRAAGLGGLLEEPAAQPPDAATARLVALLEEHGAAPARADFFRSLAEQIRGGRALSAKQRYWLGRIFLDSRDRIPAGDFAAACAEAGLEDKPAETVDPEKARRVIAALSRVERWTDPAPARRGRKGFDDKEFFASVSAQYGARGVLTAPQMRVLDRMLLRYAGQVPEAAQIAADYGIEAKPRAARRPKKA